MKNIRLDNLFVILPWFSHRSKILGLKLMSAKNEHSYKINAHNENTSVKTDAMCQ